MTSKQLNKIFFKLLFYKIYYYFNFIDYALLCLQDMLDYQRINLSSYA